MLIPEVDADRLREVCERYGVASLEAFGSVARNEDRQDSDVDLLYVLKPEARLGFRLFDLEDDLIARKAINKYTVFRYSGCQFTSRSGSSRLGHVG